MNADAKPDAPALEDVIGAIDREVGTTMSDTQAQEGAAQAKASIGVAARHIVFTLDDTRYATRLDSIAEVGTLARVTPLPNVPDWVQGVTNLRGEVLAVIDLRLLLGLDSDGGRSDRMLIVRSGDDELTAGLLVDQINGVVSVVLEQLEQPAAPMSDGVATYLVGVQEQDGRLLAVLDIEKLMQSPDVRLFEVQ